MRGLRLVSILSCIGLALASGCGSDDEAPAGPDREGLRLCCELGAICHEAGPQAAAIKRCHDIGHDSDAAQCRANYESCLEVCTPLGEGGAGGEPVEHGCG